MDLTRVLTALIPVFTALIAAGATLWGVSLTQRSAAEREERAEQSRRADATVADVRVEARHVADLLVEESIAAERIRQETAKTDDFDDRYEAHLYAETLARLSQGINMIPNADARSQLHLVIRHLPDQILFPDVLLGGAGWIFTVPILTNTAAEIASAYARGEEPDLDGLTWYRRIESASHLVDGERARLSARRSSLVTPTTEPEED